MFDHVEQVDQLLNSKDSDGNTILHLAVAQKRVQIVTYLVGEKIEGVDINAPNNSGCTPLDLLLQSRAHRRDVETGEFLRDNGAIRGRRDMHSRTPPIVPSSMRDRSMKTHGHMVGSEDWVNNMRSALMVAFQALITPAGGLFQENGSATQNNMQYGYSTGRSVMPFYAKPSYTVYMTTNTLAFLCLLGIILLLISGFPLGRRLFMWVLMIIMWVSILSLSLTYMIAAQFMTSYPGVPVPAEAPPPQMLNFYNEDNGISSHFEGIPILTFYVFWALLGVVLLGNLFRLIVRMVNNYIANKNQRRSSTSTTQDGNV